MLILNLRYVERQNICINQHKVINLLLVLTVLVIPNSSMLSLQDKEKLLPDLHHQLKLRYSHLLSFLCEDPENILDVLQVGDENLGLQTVSTESLDHCCQFTEGLLASLRSVRAGEVLTLVVAGGHHGSLLAS